jgi:tetratricopeptide (TPR) repeat protein
VGFIGLGSSYKRLAQVALLQGEPEGALTYCITAEAYLYRASPSDERSHWLLRTAEQKAWAYAKLGDFTKAIALRKHTREEFAKVHDDYAMTRNSLYTGDDYLGQVKAQVKKALSELSVDATHHADLKRRADVIHAALSMPTVRDWLESAEQQYLDARRGLEGSGQNTLMGRCLSNLGITLRYKALLDGDTALLDTAQNYLVDALSLEQGIGHWRRLPGIYEALADLAVDQNSLSGAQFYYEKALDSLDTLLVRSADMAAAAQRGRIFAGLQVVNAHLKERQPGRRLLGILGPEKWQSTCERLVELLVSFVMQQQQAKGLIALSNRDDHWIDCTYALDSAEGGRTLVQNRLSDALTVKLPAGLSPAGARTQEMRHRTFSQAIESARGTLQDTSHDICSRSHVERSLANADMFEFTYEQITNALHFLTDYPQGYQLQSSVYEVPLGYAVKRSHVLIEVPHTLAHHFDSREEVLRHKVTLCYEFHDEALARSLLEIAHEFADMCAALGDQAPNPEPTCSWLRRLRDSQTTYLPPVAASLI